MSIINKKEKRDFGAKSLSKSLEIGYEYIPFAFIY